MRTEHLVQSALSTAAHFTDSGAVYKFGAKGDSELDCSGLLVKCYPRLLPDGAANQHIALRSWLFGPSALHIARPGDVAFFSSTVDAAPIDHVAIVVARTSPQAMAI